KVWPNTAPTIARMTGHAVVIIYGLSFIQGLPRAVIHHGGFVNHSYPGEFSFLSLSLSNEQFLLVLFYLGLSPAQHGIVNEIDYTKANGKDKNILQPRRHEVVQLSDAVITVMFQNFTLHF